MGRESYWPSRGKNESRDHGISCEFFAIESIADFCPLNFKESTEEFVSHAKPILFGTVGKIISFRLFWS